MIIFLLFFWLLLFLLLSIYKFKFQYRTALDRPLKYGGVKKFLSYSEFIVMAITVGTLTSASYLYLIIIPISLGARYIINFLCFKRESDRLYNLYLNGGMKPKDALDTANFTVNRQIEQKELI